MEEITTTDLTKFGARERKMAEDLLRAWREQGLPDDFFDEDVTIMLNMNSGNVFLTNAEFQAAMMNGDKLETWYNCPECGHEGFQEDMEHDGGSECQEYVKQIKAAKEAA